MITIYYTTLFVRLTYFSYYNKLIFISMIYYEYKNITNTFIYLLQRCLFVKLVILISYINKQYLRTY